LCPYPKEEEEEEKDNDEWVSFVILFGIDFGSAVVEVKKRIEPKK
jgi:hypothetical protein